MRKSHKRLIAIVLALLLSIGAAPFGAFAAGTPDPDPYVKSDEFHFASTVFYNLQGTDQYTFNEIYFRQSSYIDNIFLAKLSAQVAISSASYFDASDPKRSNPSLNAYNLINTLTSIGFKDVRTNKYYTLENLEDSAGCAVGHMPVTANGKKYTLLAIVPRSENYKQEWAGNFEVGGGSIHQGFKAARDEVLRFTKQYIEENNITGDLKVWVTGHSRGAAISNMVGGFLAGGGAGYLGKSIRITPQDVYCYCFAPPASVFKGAPKSVELSVAGDRGGRYRSDTPGAAYHYTGSGTLDPQANIYKGIKAYLQPADFVPKLPPADWGITRYGKPQTAAGNLSWNDLLKQLRNLTPVLYDEFADGGDPASFARYTFDFASLSLVKDTKRKGSMGAFLDERGAALADLISSNADYVESGYQEAMTSLAGAYGMLIEAIFDEVKGNDSVLDTSVLIRPMILTYLAYCTDRITGEKAARGVSITEADALAIWLEDFANYISGLDVPANPTADYLVYAFTEFIAANSDSEAANRITAQFSQNLTTSDRAMLRQLVPPSKKTTATDQDLIRYFLIACARGPANGSIAQALGWDAAKTRHELYGSLSDLFSAYPGLNEAIDNGNGSIPDVAAAVISNLTEGTGGTTLGEAADVELAAALGDMLYKAADIADSIYRSNYPDYYADATRHIQGMLDHITLVRTFIATLLFTTPGEEFRLESTLANACTFFSNLSIISPAHYAEGYIGWMKARAAVSPALKLQQTIKVTAPSKNVRRSALKQKKKVLSVIKVKGAQTTLKYKKLSGSSRLKVNAANGKITIRKGTAKGTYKIRVKVTAAGAKYYKSASRKVTVKIRVK